MDDTKILEAWLVATRSRVQQFEMRLQEIKRQRDYVSSSRVNWDDIAVRWARL
jgi:hypothetical protein